MINTIEARKIVDDILTSKNQGREGTLVVWEERIVEKDYGWIFFVTAKEYLETGDWMQSIVGGLAIAVERHDGALHELDVTSDKEGTIANFEARYIVGFEHEYHQLTINAIHRWDETLDFLLTIRLMFGRLYRSSAGVEVINANCYEREQLRTELQILPFTFYHQNVRQYFRLFGAMRHSRCCDFELLPNTRRVFGWVSRTETGVELLNTEEIRALMKTKEREVL